MWTASQLLHPDLAGLGFEHVAEWTLWWMTDARPCCSPLSRLSSQVARLQLPPTRTAHRAFSSSCSSGSRCCSFSPATTPGRLDGQGSDDLRRFHRHRHVELQLLSFTFGVRQRSVTGDRSAIGQSECSPPKNFDSRLASGTNGHRAIRKPSDSPAPSGCTGSNFTSSPPIRVHDGCTRSANFSSRGPDGTRCNGTTFSSTRTKWPSCAPIQARRLTPHQGYRWVDPENRRRIDNRSRSTCRRRFPE
jgi:hypothetical protein